MFDLQLFGPVTGFLAFMTLLGHVGIVLLGLLLLVAKFMPKSALSKNIKRSLQWLSEYALLLVFAVALSSVIFSLFYSEIIGLEPCKLCWWQRIFMYPQALIFGLAVVWKKKYQSALQYGLILAVIALLIGTYQYGLQISAMINPLDPLLSAGCATSVSEASCSSSYILSYGYITIPVMSMTASVFTLIVLGIKKCFGKNNE